MLVEAEKWGDVSHAIEGIGDLLVLGTRRVLRSGVVGSFEDYERQGLVGHECHQTECLEKHHRAVDTLGSGLH